LTVWQYGGVDLRSFLLLIGTALCWGISFVFIKVGVEAINPPMVMVLRCAIGGVLLWCFIALRWRTGRHPDGVRSRARSSFVPFLINGLMTGAPLTLVAVGERTIDSGLAGVVNASVPLWAAVLAIRWDREHPTSTRRMVGVTIGFIGVVMLLTIRGGIGGNSEVKGILCSAAAAATYAISGIYVRERMAAIPAVEVAAWSVTWGGAMFLIPGLLSSPLDTSPATKVVVSIALLGVLGTFLGFLGYYELLARVGAARATMVTYLMPVLALVWGALLLNETIRPESLGALVLILLGVWIGSRSPRPAAP
jgi:drug/metabolite transporter (DMT)-like permease